MHKGEFAYEFMVIQDGEAEVMREGDHIGDLGPGDFLGEMAALEDGNRNASVVARLPMCLDVMTARDMRQLAKSIPEFGETLRTTAEQRHPLALN